MMTMYSTQIEILKNLTEKYESYVLIVMYDNLERIILSNVR